MVKIGDKRGEGWMGKTSEKNGEEECRIKDRS